MLISLVASSRSAPVGRIAEIEMEYSMEILALVPSYIFLILGAALLLLSKGLHKTRRHFLAPPVGLLGIVAIFGPIVCGSQDHVDPVTSSGVAVEACDLAWHRGIESENLAQYSRGKEMCGYLSDEASLSLELCNGVLPPLTFDPVRNCEELQASNITFGHWLNRTVELAKQECDRQGASCHSYLHNGGPIP